MKRLFLIIVSIFTILVANNLNDIKVGAEDFDSYLPLLKGKRVALVVNQTSLVGDKHLLDFLLENGINVVKIFAPEHGFKGLLDAGERVKDSVDKKRNIKIVSLYGKHKKPSKRDLADVDIVVFDIQDVGVRFYTYLSTLHYVMEAVAEEGIPIIVLDRPNPNGGRIDGEVLNFKYKSFVGLHPVPILYGMTIGEYARMINGEGWLKGSLKADLSVIPLQNWTHGSFYDLKVRPSPNLPNETAIYLYPSLALFEGTVFSVGRGTNMQFQVYGNPYYKKRDFSFIPVSMKGARFPKHLGKLCYGVDLRFVDIDLSSGINLSYLIDAYKNYPYKKSFFLKSGFFNKLAGSDKLKKQIEAGMSEEEIRKSWEKGLKEFKEIRKKYLLYP
jgi:uncharacterized protein YbbC (DUF1343 family)